MQGETYRGRMIVKDKFDSDDFENVQSPSKIGVLQYQCVSHDINNTTAKFRLVQAALSQCTPLILDHSTGVMLLRAPGSPSTHEWLGRFSTVQ